MKLSLKAGASQRNVPMLLLMAAGVIEFLFITLESRFSGLAYYLAETWLVVPCLLLMGHVLQKQQTAFVRRRLLLSVAMVFWFFVSQCIHKLSGMETHPMGTVLFVYLMAFPFASVAEDRENAGLWWIGSLFLTASLVLVLFSLLLVLDLVPAGWQDLLFWDGARLHALWHPNINACYFMIGIGFAAVLCEKTEKLWVRGLLLAAIVVQFLAMALTNCRTTLLLTGALLGGIAFFRIFRGSWKQFLVGLLAAAVLLVGSFKLSGAIFQWNNDRLRDAFGMTWEAAEEGAPEEQSAQEESSGEDFYMNEDTGVIIGDNWQGSLADDMRTLNGRTLIWGSALQAIRDDKTLALWGTEYVGTVISVYNYFPVVHAHNSWMEALMRMGLPGLLLTMLFTAVSVRSAVLVVFRKNTERWKKTVAMMTMCVMVAGFLEPYLFITNVYYHILDFIFFFCTGYLDYWCRPKETA